MFVDYSSLISPEFVKFVVFKFYLITMLTLPYVVFLSRLLWFMKNPFQSHKSIFNKKKYMLGVLKSYDFYDVKNFESKSLKELLLLDLDGILMIVFIPRSKWQKLNFGKSYLKDVRVPFRVKNRYLKQKGLSEDIAVDENVILAWIDCFCDDPGTFQKEICPLLNKFCQKWSFKSLCMFADESVNTNL